MIVSLPHDPRSRSAEMRGCKYWIKRLDSVDATRSDGYAFAGEFQKASATVEVPAGTWFMDYYKDVSGSGVVREQVVELYQVTEAGDLASRKKFDLGRSPGWALRCRDEIAAILADKPDQGDAAEAAARAAIIAALESLDGEALARLRAWLTGVFDLRVTGVETETGEQR